MLPAKPPGTIGRRAREAVDEVRIVVLTNAYPPASMGGYELLCQEHVASMRARGHQVVVLTVAGAESASSEPEMGDAGETVLRVLDFHWAAFSHRRPSGLRLFAGERRQRLLLGRVIAEHRPDAAMVWSMAAVSKSLLAVLHADRLPVVTVVEEHWPMWDIAGDAWLALWQGPLRPRALRGVRKAVAAVVSRSVAPTDVRPVLRAMFPVYCSEYMRTVIEDAVPELRGRGVVSLNGIKAELFHNSRLDTDPFRTPIRLLYSGRVERRKGVHTAIAALASLRRRGVDASLTITGWKDEAYAAELREMVRREGVDANVSWHDPLDRAQMSGMYGEHDIFLFPTLWEEPFGLAALEALACGCVVLATGSGGSGEFLKDGETALLFPPDDAEAVADLVVKLAAEPALVAALRRGARHQRGSHLRGFRIRCGRRAGGRASRRQPPGSLRTLGPFRAYESPATFSRPGSSRPGK